MGKKKVKYILAALLSATLAMGLFPQTSLAGSEHEVYNAIELASALGSSASGDTIVLMADIDYNNGISINAKTLTFSLNGHTLNVANSTGDGLIVDNGVAGITGIGAFNVNSDSGYGVYAGNGGKVTVTNATSTGTNGIAVFANGTGCEIEVLGNASSTGLNSYGVYANYGASVTVHGFTQGDRYGACANGSGSVVKAACGANAFGTTSIGVYAIDGGEIRVDGSAQGNFGAYAAGSGSSVIVAGSVTGAGDGYSAVVAETGGTVEVGGNVSISGAGSIGVDAYDGGIAKIEGTITAPVYARLQSIAKLKSDGVIGTGGYANYWVYNSGSNNVYVRIISASISPGSAAFDLYPPNQANVSTAVTWNESTAVTDVKAGGASIGAGNYSVSGNTLTINKEYLATQSAGNLALSVEFNAGSPTALTIAITNSLIPVSILCEKADAPLYGGNGTVKILASGGNSGTYQYSIDAGASWQDTNVFTVGAGTYTAVVRDALNPGNTASASVAIGQVRLVWTGTAKEMPSKANAGTALTITPPAAPRGYTFVSVTYSSTNPSVATVDASGNVTFLAGGKAKIITRVIYDTLDRYGHLKTKITTIKKSVTVKQPVASIALSQYNATIMRTQKLKLSATAAPATASSKKVRWTSSNKKVATVSSSGVVTGKGAGTAVITCTAKDGSNVSASCTVTVTPIYPTAVKISKAATTVKAGKTATLRATITPRNTDFKAIVWQSSNPAVAAVDAKGKVRGIAPGIAIITATTSNGIIAMSTVTVK